MGRYEEEVVGENERAHFALDPVAATAMETPQAAVFLQVGVVQFHRLAAQLVEPLGIVRLAYAVRSASSKSSFSMRLTLRPFCGVRVQAF